MNEIRVQTKPLVIKSYTAVQWHKMGDHPLVLELSRRWAEPSDPDNIIVERAYAATVGKTGLVVTGVIEGCDVQPGDWLVLEDGDNAEDPDHWGVYDDANFQAEFVVVEGAAPVGAVTPVEPVAEPVDAPALADPAPVDTVDNPTA